VTLTRRAFGSLALAGLAAAKEPTYKGVNLGIGAYSFRGLQMDEIIRIVSAADAGGIELESPFVEPVLHREELRRWRLTVPLDNFHALRKRFEKERVRIYAYSVPMNASFTDEEIERVLAMTKALGAPVFNTATSLSMAKRLAPFADRHKLWIGLHPSGGPSDPDAVGTGDSYLRAFALSPHLGANLDLYLYRNWGPDPMAFLEQYHQRVTTLHFHDRKVDRNPPVWVPFGEGDLPTREVLLLAKKEKYQFTFSIERIYTVPGLDQLTEIRRSLDYCRGVLA
jgi:sugar phosphate isomerase/epimerase